LAIVALLKAMRTTLRTEPAKREDVPRMLRHLCDTLELAERDMLAGIPVWTLTDSLLALLDELGGGTLEA
jgi:hypothetical protein